MKTAEEWAKDFHVAAHSEIYTVNKLKQIQLDAMKEGYRRAAEVTLNISAVPVSRKLIKDEMRETILTVSEQLAEKDL